MKTLKPLKGNLRVPGDKSIAHRALIFGALAQGGLSIRGLPTGQDVKSTRACLLALGSSFKEDMRSVTVLGGAFDKPWKTPRAALNCGNSGTTMRLLMGLLSGMPLSATLIGDASLSMRPMARVAKPLRDMGASIELTAHEFAPVRIQGKRPLKALRFFLPVPSAQVKSAFILAALSADKESMISDRFDTRDHTERMISWLGPNILRRDGHNIYINPGPLIGDAKTLHVPGDISSAAFFVAAACLVPGSDIKVLGVGVNPTRTGFIETLKKMGADIKLENTKEEAGEPVADIHVKYANLRNIWIKPEQVPAMVDEIPLLAVLAASAKGISRLEGLEELRLKESDRLQGTAAGLRALGVNALVENDSLNIDGGKPFKGARVETLADHRLAMAFFVAGLAAEGEVALSDSECVSISYPGFFSDLKVLCA